MLIGGVPSKQEVLARRLPCARTSTGESELAWSEAESQLSGLIAEFGPASKTGRAQSAAYPFTRLRSDGVWTLNRDVPMDLVRPLATDDVVGRCAAGVGPPVRLLRV